MGVGDRLGDEVGEAIALQQHHVRLVADHHAGGLVVAESFVEGEPECVEERAAGRQVGDGQVEEQQAGHGLAPWSDLSGVGRSGHPKLTGAGFEQDLERLRPALTGYCYRMLGSGFEADDATQETMIRAWRRSDTLHERAALKSWLFRIATNVCLDQIGSRKRRERPDLGDAGTADTPVGAPLPESTWVLPIADGAGHRPRGRPGDADGRPRVAPCSYDVVFDMPPLALWLRGLEQAGEFMLGQGAACRGSKLIAVDANGCPAFASYKPDPGVRRLAAVVVDGPRGSCIRRRCASRSRRPQLPPAVPALALPDIWVA